MDIRKILFWGIVLIFILSVAIVAVENLDKNKGKEITEQVANEQENINQDSNEGTSLYKIFRNSE